MKSLADLFHDHNGKASDKWSSNIHEYDKLFLCLRDRRIRMLEIGVQNGGSLELWGKYFHNAELIIGLDIDEKCIDLKYEDPRIKVVVGDSSNEDNVANLSGIASCFDIIIDDGSHGSSDIVKSFLNLFQILDYGGLYIIEDLHCSYWKSFQGGLYDPTSSIAFFKLLVDVINHEHWGVPSSCADLFINFVAKYRIDISKFPFDEIHSLQFLNSLCVVKKEPQGHNVLGSRYVVGKEFQIYDVHNIQEYSSFPPSQIENPWAVSGYSSEEGWERKKQDVSTICERISQLESKITTIESEKNNLTRFVRQLNNLLLEREKDIGILGRDLSDLSLRNSSIANEIHLIRKSNSWVLTAPARWIGVKARRLVGILQVAVRQYSRHGGFYGIIRKLGYYYEMNGMSGINECASKCHALLSCPPENLSNGRNDYREWVRRYDTVDEPLRIELKQMVKTVPSPPLLISVVMPVYNPRVEWLNEAVLSVQNQIYPHWELCIADDASTDAEIRKFLERIATDDPRIKVCYRSTNGHISEASNSALKLATGSWVALLDHDDMLTEHALYWVAHTIVNSPDAFIIYTDEDKIDKHGQRFSPHFKTDWNPDLLYNQNYISHLGVYRHEMLKEVGGFRAGFEGSQDYDLLLRCLRYMPKEGKIIHIPRILYHWRAGNDSTASDPNTKTYSGMSGLNALEDYFASSSQAIAVEAGSVPNTYRVRYPLPNQPPLVSLLVPTRDRVNLLRTCVFGLLDKTSYTNIEVIILNNGSVECETLDFLASIPRIDSRVRVLHYDQPFNFSAINNFGVQHSRGSILGLVNNDVEVINPEWLSEMVSHALRDEIGCVGAKLYYGENTLQHAGIVLGIGSVAGHSHKYFSGSSAGYFSRLLLQQSVSAVTAACLVVRREIYNQVKGLDEVNLKIAFNDVDFCLRVREAGYRNLWTPYAELYHHESVTRGAENTPEKQARFKSEVNYMLKRWGKLLSCDPYYNPNLTILHEDFSLSWPPRLPCPPFKNAAGDELVYLHSNPDVAKLVALGQYKSGWQHFIDYGAGEGRFWGSPPNLTGY